MADILHDLPIKAPIARVFDAFSTSAGIDTWWTKTSTGEPKHGAEYTLGFGPGYDWRARVSRLQPGAAFELEMIAADDDWLGTRVGVELEDRDGVTWVGFYHRGWPATNEHYRISCNCWAMYLRVLRRYLEHDEQVPYELRLGV